MDTKYGRGTLKMKCDDRARQVRYSIENSNEGMWKFQVLVHPNDKGSVLNLKCWAPRKIPYQTFHLRVSDLEKQLQRFKTLVEAKRL